MRRFALILAVLLGASALVAAGGRGFVVWQQARHAEINGLLVEARAKMRDGQNADAEALFARYLASRPRDAKVRREYAGVVLTRIAAGSLSAKESVSVFMLLERAVQENPDDHWLRFQLARFLVRIQQFSAGEEHLTRLREECGLREAIGRPGAPAKETVACQEVDELFIEMLVKTGRVREAMEVVSRDVGFDPVTRHFLGEPVLSRNARSAASCSNAVFQKLATWLANDLNDKEAAGRVHVRNTLVNAHDAQAWISLAGWKYLHDHDVPAAIKAVEKAAEIAPDDSVVMDATFQVAVSRDRYDEAGMIVSRGLDLHPGQEWPYRSKATLALREGDVDATFDALVMGLTKSGPRLSLLQMLVGLPDEPAWTRAMESRLAELEPLLEHEERFRVVVAARVLMAKGAWLEAARALEAARPLAAALPSLRLTVDLALARCYAQVGDFDLQLAACERAFAADAQSIEAQIGVAKALVNCGRNARALRELRGIAESLSIKALATRPDIWVPLLRLESSARTDGGAGQRDRKWLDGLIRSLAETVTAEQKPLLRAESLVLDGKVSEALAVLDAAQADDPGNSAIAAATIALHARSANPQGIIDLVEALPPHLQNDSAVTNAEADACGSLPPVAASRVAGHLYGRRPGDLRAAMAALNTQLRLDRPTAIADIATNVVSIAGAGSTHARYAQAAGWVQGRWLTRTRLSAGDTQEMGVISQQLAELKVERPQWTEVLCLQAKIDLLEREAAEAISRYQEALATRPSDPDIARALATLLMQRQQFAEAERALEQIDSIAIKQIGRIAADLRVRVGKRDEALEIATQAAESDATSAEDLLWFGQFFLQHDLKAKALNAAHRAVELAPERIDVWLPLADLEAYADDHRALEILEQAGKSVTEASQPLVRAEVDRRSGRMAEAVSAYREMLDVSSPSLLVVRRAAECFTEAGRADEARAAMERVMEMRPESLAGHEMICWARRRLAENDLRHGSFYLARKAIQLLRENSGEVGKHLPEDAGWAAALLAQRPEPKSWREAILLLDTLMQQQPLSVQQQVLAARLRDRLGDWRRAGKDLMALAVKPDMSAEVYEALVRMLIAHDDQRAAQTWLGTLVSLAANDPKTIELEARLALSQGDRRTAIAAAKKLMPAGDVTEADVPTVLVTAGVMEELGFIAAADNLLSRAAAVSAAGVSARIPFLIRQSRGAEAADVLEASRDALSSQADLRLLEALVCEATGKSEDAERVLGKLIEDPRVSFALRAEAVSRLAFLMLDRDDGRSALALADKATRDLGPHPDLLDARGMARIATGNLEGALLDLEDASLAPTPARLLHFAQAKSLGEDYRSARAILEYSLKSGLNPEKLRPADQGRFDFLTKKLGLATQALTNKF